MNEQAILHLCCQIQVTFSATKFGPAHVILVPITYTQKPILKFHADISRGANLCFNLHLQPYFAYSNREALANFCICIGLPELSLVNNVQKKHNLI